MVLIPITLEAFSFLFWKRCHRGKQGYFYYLLLFPFLFPKKYNENRFYCHLLRNITIYMAFDLMILVTSMKYLVKRSEIYEVSWVLLPKTLIWNKKAFYTWNYLKLAEQMVSELKKIIFKIIYQNSFLYLFMIASCKDFKSMKIENLIIPHQKSTEIQLQQS